MFITDMIRNLYHIKLFGKVFHTLSDSLQNALIGCDSVLDLGCGPSSPIQHCRGVSYSCGVDAYAPYIEESKAKGIHSKYLCKRIQDVDFPSKSFDAVVLIEVLEHMQEEEAIEVLKKCKSWARKKIILTTPNGYIDQKALDSNELQKHLSGWDVGKLESLGFKVKGLAGLKCLRSEVQSNTMGDDLTVSIRFRPRIFWFFVATLSQVVVYHLPKYAFELFCVMDTE